MKVIKTKETLQNMLEHIGECKNIFLQYNNGWELFRAPESAKRSILLDQMSNIADWIEIIKEDIYIDTIHHNVNINPQKSYRLTFCDLIKKAGKNVWNKWWVDKIVYCARSRTITVYFTE